MTTIIITVIHIIIKIIIIITVDLMRVNDMTSSNSPI